MRPAKTLPAATPMCSGSRGEASSAARTVRSIRSSSSPAVVGTPATEDDATADLIDVALEEADAVRGGRLLQRVHDLLDRVGDGIDALVLEQLVDSAEADECDRAVTMLALDLLGGEVLAEGLRHAAEQVEVGDVRDLWDAGQRDSGRRRDQGARAFAVAEVGRIEKCCRRVADGDLAGFRRVLHLDGVRRVRAGDDQLTVAASDEEEVEGATVDTDVHAELDVADRRLERAECAQRVAHAPGRRACTARVLGTVEEEQHCVAAKLHEPSAVFVRHPEQTREGGAHHVGDFLGAESPLRREALGHRRKARDVDERRRPLERPSARGRIRPQPFERDPRQVRHQLDAGRVDQGLRPGSPTQKIVTLLTRKRKGRIVDGAASAAESLLWELEGRVADAD